jgi:hypothetical protein
VGDINEFFKTDKKTEEDIDAYITEKLNSTSLCRFSAYPAFTGNIESTETLSVTVSGKDCGTPQWYINDGSNPVASGNTLVAGIENLLSGENDITVKVTNPLLALTNSLYLKRTLTALPNQPATAISVSMKPNNPSTVPDGVFCTRTASITGSYIVSDPDGGSVIVTKWYDTDEDGVRVLRQSHTTTLASGTTSGTDTLAGRFNISHIITFEATADGVPSNTVSAKIT